MNKMLNYAFSHIVKVYPEVGFDTSPADPKQSLFSIARKDKWPDVFFHSWKKYSVY